MNKSAKFFFCRNWEICENRLIWNCNYYLKDVKKKTVNNWHKSKKKTANLSHALPQPQGSGTALCNTLRTCPHKCVFVWKRINFDALRPSVHWAFSSKTYRIKNALDSGSKRKRIHIVLVWTDENGRKHIKITTMTENIAGFVYL